MDDKNKYNNALEKLQEALAPKNGCEISGLTRGCIESIFPELAISEDEKIRKEIIEYIKTGTYHKDWIAWLEKQGEKPQGKTAFEAIKEKPTDNTNKVEPKFHEGEWIAREGLNTAKIISIEGDRYEVEFIDGNKDFAHIDYIDRIFHLWTIQDAKDGDVLVSDNIVFIFNKIHNKIHDVWINCHCSTHQDGSFMEEDFDLMTIKYRKEVHPATKEQSNKLLKAMADAGWQFDFEKLELKKIELSSAWSEEDEKNLTRAIWYVENPALNVVKDIMLSEWLKSIKGRVQPQKQWKPSDEQIIELHRVISGCSYDIEQLVGLETKLKEL